MVGFITTHIKSIFSKAWTKDRIMNAFILFRMREGRGSGFTGQFYDYIQKGAIFTIFAMNFGLKITSTMYLIFGIGYLIVCYYIGFIDEKRIGLWQKEKLMETSYINPYYQKLEKDIESIKKALKVKDGRG